ncbi:MAG: hypothetical protein H6695_11915 [Deferribacteres bacterium]|nr:hypothetical protein [Deferribacteres bacterium]
MEEMWEAAEKEILHNKVNQLWGLINKGLGPNPFVIAADQGISVKFFEFDSTIVGSTGPCSQFRPDEMAIEIHNTTLEVLWDDLFPGCSPDLKFRYACWRELWQYWLHTRLAPLRWVLGEEWLEFISLFSSLSSLKKHYLGQYFASLATGVLVYEGEHD